MSESLDKLSISYLDNNSLNTYFSHISEVETFVDDNYNETTFHNLPPERYLSTWDSLTMKAKQNVFVRALSGEIGDDEATSLTQSETDWQWTQQNSQNYGKEEKYKQLPSESRYEYLCRSYVHLTDALNSGDIESFKTIINNTFLPDAKIKTDKQKDFMIGRDNLWKIYIGVLHNIPDYIGTARIVKQDSELMKNIITVEVMSVGTRVNIPNHQYTELFSTLKESLLLSKQKNQKVVGDPKILEAKVTMARILNENKQAKFLAKSYVHLILNQEMTHVEFCIQRLVSLQTALADIQVYFE